MLFVYNYVFRMCSECAKFFIFFYEDNNSTRAFITGFVSSRTTVQFYQLLFLLSGLWKACVNHRCYDLNNAFIQQLYSTRERSPGWLKTGEIPTWLIVCRISIIAACLVCFLGSLLSVLTLVNHYVHGYCVSAVMLIAFSCLATSVYLFQDEVDYDTEMVSCGVGWITGWFSVICAFATFFTGFCTF